MPAYHETEAPLRKEPMTRNILLTAAAVAVAIALGGCAGSSQQADQAEAAAQRAQDSASRAEEAAAEALQASQQALEASERAEKSVEEATKEINAVADRMEKRRQARAHKSHKKKIAAAHAAPYLLPETASDMPRPVGEGSVIPPTAAPAAHSAATAPMATPAPGAH